MKETDQYFAIEIRLDGANLFGIWASSDPDYVATLATKELAFFTTHDKLATFAQDQLICIEQDSPASYDFDLIIGWTVNRSCPDIDCVNFLNAWNILADIAFSVSTQLVEPGDSQAVYEKLFCGNNLPAVTPDGEHFEPEWTQTQANVIAEVMLNGIQILRDGITRPC